MSSKHKTVSWSNITHGLGFCEAPLALVTCFINYFEEEETVDSDQHFEGQ